MFTTTIKHYGVPNAAHHHPHVTFNTSMHRASHQECSGKGVMQLCPFLFVAWRRRVHLAAHGPLSPSSTSRLSRRSARPLPCRPSPQAVHSQTSHSCLPFTASTLWEKQYRVANRKKKSGTLGGGRGEGDAEMRAMQFFSGELFSRTDLLSSAD